MKKPKKKTVSQLRSQLDKLFSLYVRKKYADRYGKVECYTCRNRKEITGIHCGHFISRSYLATRYDEENVRPQCVGCNIFGGGRSVEFGRRLEKDSGVGTVTTLYKKAQEITKNFPYEEKIKYYQEKLKEMK